MPPPTLLRVDTTSPTASSPSGSSPSSSSSPSHRPGAHKPSNSTRHHESTKSDGKSGGDKPRRRSSCSSPRYSSLVASPSSSSSRPTTATSPRSSPPPAQSCPPMSMTTYFSLLKKSQVLEQLLRLSGHASARELELQRLEREKSRADCVHARVFADLALFQTQFVDAQKCSLELLEQLTALCLAGPSSQQGVGGVESEEQTLRDLHRVVAASDSSSRGAGGGGVDTVSVETQALREVGRDRVRQLKEAMQTYERQLVGLEAELSRAVHSSAVVDLTARVRELEAREQQHMAAKMALEEELRRSQEQTGDLQTQLDRLQDDHVALGAEKRAADQLLDDQSVSIERFGTALRAELRRRYGMAPSVLELRWREFFPTIALPM